MNKLWNFAGPFCGLPHHYAGRDHPSDGYRVGGVSLPSHEKQMHSDYLPALSHFMHCFPSFAPASQLQMG
jgi:hypothetical protein